MGTHAPSIRPSAGIALVIGFVAGVAWSPFPTRNSESTRGGAAPGTHERLDLAPIETRLAAIQARLDELQSAPPPPVSTRAAGPEATSSTGPLKDPTVESPGLENSIADPDYAAALVSLERHVSAEAERTRALLRGSSVGDELLERLRTRELPTDWDAWAPILALWSQDPEQARRELELLTAEQVLERFGTPTDIWSHQPVGTTWQYALGWDALDETHGTEIILRLPEGYVTQLVVRGRDW